MKQFALLLVALAAGYLVLRYVWKRNPDGSQIRASFDESNRHQNEITCANAGAAVAIPAMSTYGQLPLAGAVESPFASGGVPFLASLLPGFGGYERPPVVPRISIENPHLRN